MEPILNRMNEKELRTMRKRGKQILFRERVKKNAAKISVFVGLISYPISVLLDKVGIWGIITCCFFAGFLLTKKPKEAHWIGERPTTPR